MRSSIKSALFAGLVSLSTLSASSFAFFVSGVNGTLESTWTRQPNGQWVYNGEGSINAIGPNGEVYKNNTTIAPANNTITQGPGATLGTNTFANSHLLADDLTLDAAAVPGSNIIRFSFTMVNGNAAQRSARPTVSFYANDGAGGGPGTEIAGFLFNPVTIPANTGGFVSFTIPAASQFAVPANRFFWAGVSFDNGGTSTTSNAELDNWGQFAFNPPTIGSSPDNAFVSTNPTDSASNNPAGTQGNFNASPIANFGWELRVAVPEPGSITLAGVGLLGLIARRRRA